MFSDYKHPRWQKLRLQAMSRAKFKCEACNKSDEMLEVHHLVYPKGKKVYETSVDNLCVMCHDCHVEATKMVDFVRMKSLSLLRASLNLSERFGGLCPTSLFVIGASLTDDLTSFKKREDDLCADDEKTLRMFSEFEKQAIREFASLDVKEELDDYIK